MAEYLITGAAVLSGRIWRMRCWRVAMGGRAGQPVHGKRANLAPEVRVIEGNVADPGTVDGHIGMCGVVPSGRIASVAYCNEHWREGHLTNQTGTVRCSRQRRGRARAGSLYIVRRRLWRCGSGRWMRRRCRAHRRPTA